VETLIQLSNPKKWAGKEMGLSAVSMLGTGLSAAIIHGPFKNHGVEREKAWALKKS
jgi:hypothetical protein